MAWLLDLPQSDDSISFGTEERDYFGSPPAEITRTVPESLINRIASMVCHAQRKGRKEAYNFLKQFVLEQMRVPDWPHYPMNELRKLTPPPLGGSIINTASIQSFDPSPNLIAYASTKAAMISFTRSLAGLAIRQGVRVNAVAPGPAWTPLIPSTMPKEKVKQFGAHTLFGRAAQPAELAPIFVFSCQRSSQLRHR